MAESTNTAALHQGLALALWRRRWRWHGPCGGTARPPVGQSPALRPGRLRKAAPCISDPSWRFCCKVKFLTTQFKFYQLCFKE